MTRSRSLRSAALAALSFLLLAGVAAAQERGGFLDNLFNRGEQQQQQAQEPQQQQAQQPQAALPGAGDSDDLGSRVDRIENALRQLTGTVEELQHQNQLLQMQLQRLQDDTEYRFRQMGARAPAPAAGVAPVVGAAPQAPTAQPPPQPMTATEQVNANDSRSDAFNPALHPNAPGAPRSLGGGAAAVPPAGTAANLPPVGAPNGRAAGQPLDLTMLSGNPNPPAPSAFGAPVAGQPLPGNQLTPNNAGAAGTQLATLPPSKSPKDEYELAYGYVLHKDYGLAEQAFRDFVRKYPDEKLAPDAEYWLGESQYQQQRYRDAAESFLAVSTKYASSGKAPDALLRLGQSLAQLHQKEAACATLAEVGRKYPRASASVKRAVRLEQKRTRC
jgi:tol-pal system protein YbgF